MQITIGQYFPGRSALHRMDPRAKILLTIAMIAAVFAAGTWLGYVMLFAFAFAAIRVSGVGMKFVLRGLKPIFFIVVLTFLINIFFTTGGTALVHWKFINITDKGLYAATRMALRLILLVLVTQLLTLTTSSIALTDAIEALLKPLSKIGFPAHEMAMMMSLSLIHI